MPKPLRTGGRRDSGDCQSLNLAVEISSASASRSSLKHGTASLKTLALDCTVHEQHASSLHGKSKLRRDKPRIKRNLRKRAAMPPAESNAKFFTQQIRKQNKKNIFNKMNAAHFRGGPNSQNDSNVKSAEKGANVPLSSR